MSSTPPTKITLYHPSLKATLTGETTTHSSIKINHFRGIPYASVTQRFTKATPIDTFHGPEVDGTKFGPICPQNCIDPGYLLRLPSEFSLKEEPEQDEFKCLNLNVSVPADIPEGKKLPVLIWIYGGSQTLSFPPPSHPLLDPTPLLTTSIESSTPIIIITLNYRLNIFGFGDDLENGERNLALQDQRLAIEWVGKHVGGFGGDNQNITLAGESAGAVYVHAHLITSAPIPSRPSQPTKIRRAILQSGSLSLSPPLTPASATSLISNLTNAIVTKHSHTLSSAPVPILLSELREQNVVSLWLQTSPPLRPSPTPPTAALSNPELDLDLLIGDCEHESNVWSTGLSTVPASEIDAIFSLSPTHGEILKRLYSISKGNPHASRIGALDFIVDVRFGLPVEEIVRLRRGAANGNGNGIKTYRYLFDQPNPWQGSTGAHHAVDLIYLFLPSSSLPSPSSQKISTQMKKAWIRFVNGLEPWEESERFAFGPLGTCGTVDEEEFADRRRTRCFEVLRGVDEGVLAQIVGRLAGGRISLLN